MTETRPLQKLTRRNDVPIGLVLEWCFQREHDNKLS
jgi:hypothetical protein